MGPKGSKPSSGNAFAGPYQGLQNLSARDEGKQKKRWQKEKDRIGWEFWAAHASVPTS